MAQRPVVSYKNFPAQMGISAFIAQYLLLVHPQAPIWLIAVWGTLVAVLLIAKLVLVYGQEQVDIFNLPEAKAPSTTRRAKRMAEIQAEQAARKKNNL